MAVYSFKRRTRHTTRTPSIQVAGNLDPGTYLFELRVKDDSGNVSAPARIKVRVVRRVFPGGGRIIDRDLLDFRGGGVIVPPGGGRGRGG